MSGSEGSPARQGQPLLLVLAGVLVGAGLALVAGLVLFSGSGPTASASPGPSLTASFELPSAIPSPSELASTPPETTAPTAAPTAGPTPGPTANTNPAIVTWQVPTYEDCTGSTAGMVHVEWSIKRATGVTISIDGPGIYDSYPGTSGSVDLPYGCSTDVLKHTYTLKTTGGTGPAASSTKTIRTRPPEVLSFVMPNLANCAAMSGTTFVAVSYEIRAATGIELWRGSQLYATYSGKTSSDGLTVPYDCTKSEVNYKIVTTGGYGDPDSQIEKVTRYLTP
jgi:hypothetical protein